MLHACYLDENVFPLLSQDFQEDEKFVNKVLMYGLSNPSILSTTSIHYRYPDRFAEAFDQTFGSETPVGQWFRLFVAKNYTADIFVKATSEELRSDKDFMHQAVKLNLPLLQCAPPDMRVDLAVSVAFGNDAPTTVKS